MTPDEIRAVALRAIAAFNDDLAWRFRFAGTHLGEFQGIPASGRPFDIPGITVLRFGERRCVERWSAADFLTMMIQIGAIPAPA